MSEIAIVTGAAGGIGSALVKALESMNYYVLQTDLYPAQSLPSQTTQSRALALDLRDAAWIDQLSEELGHCPGELTAVIHAAGIETMAPITDQAAWEETFAVNFWPLCRLTELLVDQAKASPKKTARHILTIGSFMAHRGHPGRSAYSASKLALEAFVKNAAVELARYQIRANCISPAWVETDLARRAIQDIAQSMQISAEDADHYLRKRTPLRKFIKPDEIADLARFLMGPSGTSFTGQVLTIDNGLSAVIP